MRWLTNDKHSEARTKYVPDCTVELCFDPCALSKAHRYCAIDTKFPGAEPRKKTTEGGAQDHASKFKLIRAVKVVVVAVAQPTSAKL